MHWFIRQFFKKDEVKYRCEECSRVKIMKTKVKSTGEGRWKTYCDKCGCMRWHIEKRRLFKV